jgi:hypothetical protein
LRHPPGCFFLELWSVEPVVVTQWTFLGLDAIGLAGAVGFGAIVGVACLMWQIHKLERRVKALELDRAKAPGPATREVIDVS